MPAQKTLIYVPILHSVVDMGTLVVPVRNSYWKSLGMEKWFKQVEETGEIWERIGKGIKELELPLSQVKIYQDGLPICGKEREILNELADQGSANHRLIQRLIHQGATLIGTEDPDLLLREYRHLKNIHEAKRYEDYEKFFEAYETEKSDLLRRRDEKIAERIRETLQDSEIGLLFIGALHHVDELLREEFQIRYVGKPWTEVESGNRSRASFAGTEGREN